MIVYEYSDAQLVLVLLPLTAVYFPRSTVNVALIICDAFRPCRNALREARAGQQTRLRTLDAKPGQCGTTIMKRATRALAEVAVFTYIRVAQGDGLTGHPRTRLVRTRSSAPVVVFTAALLFFDAYNVGLHRIEASFSLQRIALRYSLYN